MKMRCTIGLLSLLLVLTIVLVTFCTPTPVSAADIQTIRVLLDEELTQQTVSGELSWYGEQGLIGDTSGEVNIGLSGGGVVTRVAGTQHYARRFSAIPLSGYVSYGGRDFRGRLEFFPGKAGGVVVVNFVPLEDYLAGVVPAEMPAAWPAAALEAQAIAARTYALSRMAAMNTATYDVASTTADQMYRGVAGEDARTTAAVQATAGLIMTYQGHPIVAYFCSDAGGYTKAGSEPYLKAVPSLAVDSPYNEWTFELSPAELNELVAATGTSVGTITGVKAQHNPVSGHLESLTITGLSGSCTFSGVQLRRYIGRSVMRSTRVRFEPIGNAQVGSTAAPPPTPAPRPAGTSGPEFETVTMEGFMRPWVATGDRDEDIKLRSMYASNGWDVEQCDRTVHAYAGEVDQPVTYTAPPPAALSTTSIDAGGGLGGLTARGSGYGHGMGMSQWGARQLALDGYSYDVILNHFYTGVELIRWNGDIPPPAPAAAPDDSEFYQPFGR